MTALPVPRAWALRICTSLWVIYVLPGYEWLAPVRRPASHIPRISCCEPLLVRLPGPEIVLAMKNVAVVDWTVPPLDPRVHKRLTTPAAGLAPVNWKVPPLSTTVLPAPSVEAEPLAAIVPTLRMPPLMATAPVKSLAVAVMVRVPEPDLVIPAGPVTLPELASV